MANSEHLAILAKGVDVWNAWRLEHPEIFPDLKDAELIDADLRQINLGGPLEWTKVDATYDVLLRYLAQARREVEASAIIAAIAAMGESMPDEIFIPEYRRPYVDLYRADFCGADLSDARQPTGTRRTGKLCIFPYLRARSKLHIAGSFQRFADKDFWIWNRSERMWNEMPGIGRNTCSVTAITVQI